MERLQLLLKETEPEKLAVGAAVALLALLVIWWLARRGGGSSPGPEGQDASVQNSDAPESERIFRLLAQHADLGAFPDHFLHDLLACLRNRENVVGFIALADKYRLVDRSLCALAGSDADAAKVRLAAALADEAGRHPENADQLMQLAARIDRDNLRVSVALAVNHFDAGRYQEALPLLERAIPACRRDMEEAAGSRSEDLEQLLERSMDMYEACLDRGAG